MSIQPIFHPEPDPPPADFRTRMKSEPHGVVVLLGAGASASLGCPMVRGFIDAAMDLVEMKQFTCEEERDVQRALAFYRRLRAHLQLTSEDTENIETILSFVDMGDVLGKLPSIGLDEEGRQSIRRFIDHVITKSQRLLPPTSPDWLSHNEPLQEYKSLVRALAYYRNRACVITLNYDCGLEYICHCLGLDFTYDRSLGDGVEIIKLHGSLNWYRCASTNCPSRNAVRVSPLRFVGDGVKNEHGHLMRIENRCPECGSPVEIVIVPPTWAKRMDDGVLQRTWARALKNLSEAEAFVSIGYSLPVTDVAVRYLLHLGFAGERLRQGLAIVGRDREAKERWRQLFQGPWGDSHFEAYEHNFELLMDSCVYPALVVPPIVKTTQYSTVPLRLSVHNADMMVRRLSEELERHGFEVGGKDPFSSHGNKMRNVLQEGMRRHRNLPEEDRRLAEVMKAVGLWWEPPELIEPVHGSRMSDG